jgi:hypothetical protein
VIFASCRRLLCTKKRSFAGMASGQGDFDDVLMLHLYNKHGPTGYVARGDNKIGQGPISSDITQTDCDQFHTYALVRTTIGKTLVSISA